MIPVTKANIVIKQTVALKITPLHLASIYRNTDEVKALIGAGADPNQASIFGITALNIASKQGDIETQGTWAATLKQIPA